MRLYYLHTRGCPACEEGWPHARRFAVAHQDVEVVAVDLLEAKWSHPWSPEATPTYVVEELGFPRVQHVGMLNLAGIERFVVQAIEVMTGRPIAANGGG